MGVFGDGVAGLPRFFFIFQTTGNLCLRAQIMISSFLPCRAFIAAGVPAVIVSLWAVSDKHTAQMMIQFYRNLIEKKMNITVALRNAMLETMETAPDPKYWAAFTLVGAILQEIS